MRQELSSWFFFVALILTQSMFKRTLSKYEVNVNVEGKTLVDIIDCNRGNLQLQITSAKVLRQVFFAGLKFHYNWKTAGPKKKGKAIDLS